MADTKAKIEETKAAAAEFDPLSKFPAGWYRLHLKKENSGSGSRIVKVGNGQARFKATQTDEKADNFHTKLVMLTAEQVRDYTRSPDWQITKANPPEPKGLGKGVVSRTIGASKPNVEEKTTEA